jgi:hypothetical protein
MKSVTNMKARNWIFLGLAVLAAIRLYRVQEMVAALAIFSALFVLAAGTALFLFLLYRVSQRSMAWAVPPITYFAQRARRGWARAAEFCKSSPHYSHSATVLTRPETKN